MSTNPQVVFLSDLHIGENMGGVSGVGGPSYTKIADKVYVRDEFQTLLGKLKKGGTKVKYLVLLGDIWDLAVQPMPYTTNLSLKFFNSSTFKDFFEEIIYISGNHDHHLWRMYQTQKCEIDPLKADASQVDVYPQVIPGVLDFTGAEPILTVNGKESKGDSFIQGLIGNLDLPVHVVYPNLYVIYNGQNGKEAALATHGHLFDPGWNIVTDYLMPTFKEMGLQTLDLKNLEMLNSPVTEFWNYSMAQTGNYNMIENIYDGCLKGEVSKLVPVVVEDLVEDLEDYLLNLIGDASLVDKIKRALLKKLTSKLEASILELLLN